LSEPAEKQAEIFKIYILLKNLNQRSMAHNVNQIILSGFELLKAKCMKLQRQRWKS